MATRSKMDPAHISQITFDEDLEAVRVHVLPTEIEMSLSAESGDSVITQTAMQVLQVTAGSTINTSKVTKMVIISSEIVQVTALVLNQEVALGTIGIEPKAICVPAIKTDKDCIVILQS